MQHEVAQILHEPHERLISEFSVNLSLILAQNRRVTVVLPYKYARVFDERQRRCHKVVDASRYFTMGLLAGVQITLRHQTETFIGIIHATRNLDEFLGIHAKDVEQKCPMVEPVDVFHPSRRMNRVEKIAPGFTCFAHDPIPTELCLISAQNLINDSSKLPQYDLLGTPSLHAGIYDRSPIC